MLTQTGQYAIRAMVCIAEAQVEARITAAQIAERTELPRNYMAKILPVLAHAGLLGSARGPHGGYRLTRPADKLTVASVLAPFEHRHGGDCLLSVTCCRHRGRCRSRQRCLALAAAIDRFLRTTRISDLAGPRGT